MPRYRMTVRFNAFKALLRMTGGTWIFTKRKAVITREELYQWTQSRNLRHFLRACERSLQANPPPDGAETSWLAWARSYADAIDPFTNGNLQKVITRERNAALRA